MRANCFWPKTLPFNFCLSRASMLGRRRCRREREREEYRSKRRKGERERGREREGREGDRSPLQRLCKLFKSQQKFFFSFFLLFSTFSFVLCFVFHFCFFYFFADLAPFKHDCSAVMSVSSLPATQLWSAELPPLVNCFSIPELTSEFCLPLCKEISKPFYANYQEFCQDILHTLLPPLPLLYELCKWHFCG